MNKKTLILILFLIISKLVFAQALTENPKNPTKAILLSAFIPGAGQIYNENYIKGGITIGLQTFFISSIIYYDDQMSDYKKLENSAKTTSDKNFYHQRYLSAHENRRNSGWWAGTVLLLSMVDAYVDAHLYNFDSTKKNLKLKFKPNYIGLKLEF